MCGICGIINFDEEQVDSSKLKKMMQIMKHRGPDDEGIFAEKNIGFGFVRLSIIDLSIDGHQPMSSKDQRYVVVFNGELYNYIELREELTSKGVIFNTKTDTEVLLNSYIYWGEECLHKFNGMWSFAIYDKQEKKVFVARDRYGVKPFYYIQSKNSFAFCSEIPPLLSLLKEKPNVNNQSIFDFLVFNRTDQTEETFFKEVKKLQHGCKMAVEPEKKLLTSITKWYNLRDEVKRTEGFKTPDEYKKLFSSAIQLRLRSDVPVGVCLSGGLDSSSIVSILLNDFQKNDLHTFSAVYNKGQVGDETEFINEYKPLINNMFFTTPDANTLQDDLTQFVKIQGEPIPSTSPYAQFKVMKLAQGKVVVTLDGQGADEELGGYHYFYGYFFKDLLLNGHIFTLINEIFNYVIKHKSLMGIKSFAFFLLPKNFRTKLRVNEKGYLHEPFIEQYTNSNSISGNLYGSTSLNDSLLDHFEYKLEHLLKWEDRNSMAFSLESRVPFLDYRLVEKSIATSSDLKIRKGMTKYILREAMKNIMPEKIRFRRDKIGFETPQDEWFRTKEWQIIINEIIQSPSFKSRKIINPEKASILFKKHLSSEINIAKEIWKWVHLELWFREFID